MKGIRGHLPRDPGALQEAGSRKPDQGPGRQRGRTEEARAQAQAICSSQRVPPWVLSWASHTLFYWPWVRRGALGAAHSVVALALCPHSLRGGHGSSLSSTEAWRGLDLWITWEIDARAGPWQP